MSEKQMMKVFADFKNVAEKEWRLKLHQASIDALKKVVEDDGGKYVLVKDVDTVPKKCDTLELIVHDSKSSLKSIVLRK